MCAAIAAAVVVFGQSTVKADQLTTVKDPIFSIPLVPFNPLPASPFLASSGWTSDGPIDPQYGVNTGTIVWQNPRENDPGNPGHIYNLITDPTVTETIAHDYDPNPDDWNLPYQGCASIAGATGNGLEQTLTSKFQANMGYTLTAAVGVSYGYPPDPTAELRIELFYDDSQGRHFLPWRDVFNDSQTGLSATYVADFSTPTTVIRSDSSDPTIRNAVGQNIGILLTTIGPVGGFFNVTNVRVDEVPEPASVAIMLTGAGLLLRRRRRRI